MPISFPILPEPIEGNKSKLYPKYRELISLEVELAGLYITTLNPFAFKSRKKMNSLFSKYRIESAEYTDLVYKELNQRFEKAESWWKQQLKE